MQTGFAESPIGFQVVVSLGGAVAFFAVAWAGFHRFTRDSQIAGRPRADLLARFIGLGRNRRSRPGKRPVAWKEFHFVAGGLPFQIAKFAIYGLVTALVFWAADRYYDFPLSRAGQHVAWAMLAVIVVESSMYASVMFHDEWRDRTLPLLDDDADRGPRRSCTAKILGLPLGPRSRPGFLAAGRLRPSGLAGLDVELGQVPGFCSSRWFFALVLLLFLTLTVFFSMVVRWGALASGLGRNGFGGAFVSSCCAHLIYGLLMHGSRRSGHLPRSGFCWSTV